MIINDLILEEVSLSELVLLIQVYIFQPQKFRQMHILSAITISGHI